MTARSQRVLFVCTGNTCRSPMAAALLNQAASRRGLPIEARSAGTQALRGRPMAPEAVKVLEEHGIDPSSHRSQKLTDAMIAEADLILTMTREQKSDALKLAPQSMERVFTFKEFVRPDLWQRLTDEAREAYDWLEEQIRFREERHRMRDQGAAGSKERQNTATQVDLDEEPPPVQRARHRLAELDARFREMDVPDPIGLPIDAYRRCAEEFTDYVEEVLRRVTEPISFKDGEGDDVDDGER